jgi:UDP-N-acetyl-D-mannosaminuronic acid dehydrogenase
MTRFLMLKDNVKQNFLCVMGLGYIGLPTAALIAKNGLKVVGVDVNGNVVETVNRGHIHIIEPGLADLTAEVVGAGKLRASTRPEPANVFLIAVPTPFRGADHEPDISYVRRAAENLAPVLSGGDCVILESTSPVGTTEKLADWLQRARPDLRLAARNSEECDVFVAYCPERVLPGRILRELEENSRVVGGVNAVSAARAADVYRLFVRGEILETDARTAEMTKLTENAFRDVNIAFANELSLICDQLDIPVWELIRLANHHPRVNILQPGPGVGGHCIAVDPWFIVHKSPELARLIRTAREVNDGKSAWVIRRVLEARDRLSKGNPGAIRIAAFGLSFKPDIDDLRESPALRIVETLAQEKDVRLLAVEPHIGELPPQLASRGNVELVEAADALARADIALFLVAHARFKNLRLPDGKIVIDTVRAA